MVVFPPADTTSPPMCGRPQWVLLLQLPSMGRPVAIVDVGRMDDETDG